MSTRPRFKIRRQKFRGGRTWYLKDAYRPAFLGQYHTFEGALSAVRGIIEREANS